MNYLNYEFFDAFKKLDKICRDIYGNSLQNKLGVTLYLEDMKTKEHLGHIHVPNWQADYNHLKHVRNIRNELAHGQTTFSNELCTQKDIDFICKFHAKILQQNDPLTLLRKQLSVPKPVYRPAQNTFPTYHPVINLTHNNTTNAEPSQSTKSRYSGCFIAVICVLFIILAALLAILFFIH